MGFETERLERWGPLLTIETEVNGDSKSTNGRVNGVLPRLVRWGGFAGTRDFCPALGALVGPVQTFCFPHRTLLFQLLFPHRPASWTGSRAGSPVSLYLSLVIAVEREELLYSFLSPFLVH